MPRLSGIEVLRELKSDPRTHDIPIVVMSSSSQERDVVESYKLGANGFVTKPINVSNFMEAVAQIGMYWLLVNQSTAQ
jgi:CheY-like chemotaxis protein